MLSFDLFYTLCVFVFVFFSYSIEPVRIALIDSIHSRNIVDELQNKSSTNEKREQEDERK